MPQYFRRIVRSAYFSLANSAIGLANAIGAALRHNWECFIAWLCVCLAWVVIALMERRSHLVAQRED